MKSETIGELVKALAAAQSEFPTISKSKEVVVRKKAGGSYKFKYAPLDAILEAVTPALGANGLIVTQGVAVRDGKHYLSTMLAHASGQFIENAMPLSAQGDAQTLGSEVTYKRRYGLTAMLGIFPDEDDDGNLASGNDAKVTPKPAEASAEQKAKAQAWADEAFQTILLCPTLADVAEFEEGNKSIIKSLEARFPEIATMYRETVASHLNKIGKVEA